MPTVGFASHVCDSCCECVELGKSSGLWEACLISRGPMSHVTMGWLTEVSAPRFLVHRYSVLQQHAEANGVDGVDALDTASHTHKSGYHDDSDEVRLLDRWPGSSRKGCSCSFQNQDLTEAEGARKPAAAT